MAYYSYVATDVNGATVKGKEYADDFPDLSEKLRSKNLFCTSYKEIEEQRVQAKYKYKTKDLAFICRQLSSMLTAGISLVKSLHILYTQEENKKSKAVLLSIYEEVQKGKSFSEAITAMPGTFPNLFISMVAAGESSGNLDMIMTRVAEHYAKENKINNKIKSATTYPMILGILLVVIVVGMFVFILPMFKDMFGGSTEDMPAFSAALFAVGDFMAARWYVIAAIVIVCIFAFKYAMRIPSCRLKFDKLKIKMPKVGPLLMVINTARFARTMSNLFASGMQMVECIEKSEQTLGNMYISEVFSKVIEDVKHGEALSTSLGRTKLFPGIFTATILVGEESGALDDILTKTADYYDEEADSAIGQLVSLLEPLMIIIMGIVIGCVLGAIFPLIYGSMGTMA